MKNRASKWMLAAVLATTVLAGCGGGGGAAAPLPVVLPPVTPVAAPTISNSISALFAYVLGLIDGSESSDLVDVNALTLATDDSSDAAPLK